MMSYTSIYVPRMSALHDEESVKQIMTRFHIGTVSRVDFTPINKKPGFGENVDNVVKSAFIHFSETFFSSNDLWNYKVLGGDDFWDTIDDDKPYKLQVSKKEYWICLRNKNPVQRTMMNIHQVVENGRHLEKIIEEQSKKIEHLERKLDATNNVVYQLLGGLFNKSEQHNILQYHLDVLDCFPTNNFINDKSKWNICPTTRQGDDCEKRIESLEKLMGQKI